VAEVQRRYLQTDGGGVLLRGDRVEAVDVPCPPGVPTLDCRGARVEPGRVNAHTHLYSGLAPLGMPAPEPPPENFVQILERVWWLLDRALDADSLRASARLYVAESLLAGTTSLIDHHESPAFLEGSLDVLADACDELGVRAALCFGATGRNGGRDEERAGLAECRRFVESNTRPLVRGLVALHASFTVSDEAIREAGALCAELGTVLHVHVAEDGADVADAQRRGFEGPLERLQQLGALAPGSILAHGVHLREAQVRAAAELGCWFVQNPRSNEGNKVGYPAALWASDRVALGTDGYPADMLEESAALARLAPEAGGAEAEASLARLVAGRRLAGERFGEVFAAPAPGVAADLIVTPAGQARPRHVIVAGRIVVEDGVLQTGDVEVIRAEASQQAPRLWALMKEI
jgi:cytosine/adenosine deaminase-related metal-dependent hydrolase